MLEQYQDIWINGRLYNKGVRECEERYKIIKDFCSKYERPFTVLDIGANLGYFSIRLMEDFDCKVVMMESPKFYASQLKRILKMNNVTDGILLEKHVDIPIMERLAGVEHFDVVLSMSVIHHISGDLEDVYNSMKKLGDNLIIEIPVEKSACNPRGVNSIDFVKGKLIGTGKSHLEDTTRPIYHIKCKRGQLKESYLRCAWKFQPPIIKSNFKEKTITYTSRKENRKWIPGINLWTYIQLNGTYPNKNFLLTKIEDYDFGEHFDIRPWNIILQGNSIKSIDESKGRSTRYDPAKAKKEMLDYLKGKIFKMKDMMLR